MECRFSNLESRSSVEFSWLPDNYINRAMHIGGAECACEAGGRDRHTGWTRDTDTQRERARGTRCLLGEGQTSGRAVLFQVMESEIFSICYSHMGEVGKRKKGSLKRRACRYTCISSTGE